MKKLSTVSLFIFGVIVTAILTAGLVFYQNGKSNNNGGNKVANAKSQNLIKNTINQIDAGGSALVLDMKEIAKHNKSSDCWMLISGKVYNVTSYFGSHPGGNSAMSPTCGTDATAAYATRDPYAQTSSGKVAHSSNAQNLLSNYYIGDLGQTIGEQKVIQTNSIITPVTRGDSKDDDRYGEDEEDEYDD